MSARLIGCRALSFEVVVSMMFCRVWGLREALSECSSQRPFLGAFVGSRRAVSSDVVKVSAMAAWVQVKVFDKSVTEVASPSEC